MREPYKDLLEESEGEVEHLRKRLVLVYDIIKKHGCSTPDCGLCYLNKKLQEVESEKTKDQTDSR